MFDEFYYRPRLRTALWNFTMVFEGDDGGDGGGGGGGSWLDEHDYLSDEDRTTLSKYTTHEDALKGASNAIRQVGKSVRFPDKTTSDEDKAKFNDRVAEYQGVPAKPEDYKIDRSGIPEGVAYDEEMENNFRQWAHASKAPQSVVDKMVSNYNKMMVGRHEAMETVAKEDEEVYRKELGNDADIKLGKADDVESIGTIKEGLLHLSAKLKLDYTDKEDNLRSHLIDDLELNRMNGQIGNKISLIKAFDYLLNIAYTEGTTVLGEPPKGKAGKEDGAFGTPGFYEHVDGEEE